MKSISTHLHLLQNDSLRHRRSSQNVSLNRRDVVSLLVVLAMSESENNHLISPSLVTTDHTQLTSSTNTTRLSIHERLKNDSEENWVQKCDHPTSIYYLPLTHSMNAIRIEEELLLCEICDNKRIVV